VAFVKGKETEFCGMDEFPLSGASSGNPRGDGVAE